MSPDALNALHNSHHGPEWINEKNTCSSLSPLVQHDLLSPCLLEQEVT